MELGQTGLHQPTCWRLDSRSGTPAWQRWCQVAREVSGGWLCRSFVLQSSCVRTVGPPYLWEPAGKQGQAGYLEGIGVFPDWDVQLSLPHHFPNVIKMT